MFEVKKEIPASSYGRPASFLLFLGAIFRVASFFLSKNSGGDAGARVSLTAHWLQHPTFKLIFEVYPPGHFWLIAALATVTPNVVVAGRLLSLVLGIASVFVVWRLARLLYGEAAGMLSLAVFAFYTMHIGYSTTSSSEVPFVFFMLVGLFFFFLYFHEGSQKLRYLAFSGIALSIAGAIRFEGWIVFGELSLLLVLLWLWGPLKRGLGSILPPLLVFGMTGGAWPAVMMTYCWRTFGDPLYLITSTHSRMATALAVTGHSVGRELVVIPTALVLSLSPLAFAAAIYGIVKSRHLPLAFGFAGIAVVFLGIQSYEILRGGFLAVARYSLAPGTMLAIISGYALELLCIKLLPHRVKLAHATVIVLLLLNLGGILVLSETPNRFADNFAAISPRLRHVTRITTVGAYLRAHMGPQDAIVIDNYNYESNIIADAAGLPLLYGTRAYLVAAHNQIEVQEYIRAEHPRFLVYSDLGALRSSFVLPRECGKGADMDGIHFQCEFANQTYRVYELSYR